MPSPWSKHSNNWLQENLATSSFASKMTLHLTEKSQPQALKWKTCLISISLGCSDYEMFSFQLLELPASSMH